MKASIGLEIGPGRVRGVRLNDAPKFSERRPQSSALEAAAQAVREVLGELGADRNTAVHLALDPPFVDSRTVTKAAGRQLPTLVKEAGLNPAEQTFVITHQKGLHEGDVYVSFANKGLVLELARATVKRRAPVARIAPWFFALPALGRLIDPSLEGQAYLHADVRQGGATLLALDASGAPEVIAHFNFVGLEDLLDQVVATYNEFGDGRPLVLTTDDPQVNQEFWNLPDEEAPLVRVPRERFIEYGQFGLAWGIATGQGLPGDLLGEALRKQLAPKRPPAALVAPVAAALVLMVLGYAAPEAQKAPLEAERQQIEAQLRQVRPLTLQAKELSYKTEELKRTIHLIEDTLFKGKWTDRLDAFYGKISPYVVASRVDFGPLEERRLGINAALASPRAEALLQTLDRLEKSYPKTTYTAVTKGKLERHPVYTTNVGVEVEK